MKTTEKPGYYPAGYYSCFQYSRTGQIIYWLESMNPEEDVNSLPAFTYWFESGRISELQENESMNF